MLKAIGVLIVSSAIYGFTVGAAHSLVYAWRDVVKFPLLIVGTALICSLSYFIVARFLTARLGFGQVSRLVVGLFRDLSVLLLSLSPPNLFLALILRHTDDSQLGEYSLFLGANVVFVAVAGSLALVRQGRSLLEESALSTRRMLAVIGGWLLLTMFVGGQAAFYMRPFFGLPVTRGNVPPFAVGTEADVRGATNFFEAVLQVFTEPPLPTEWPERK